MAQLSQEGAALAAEMPPELKALLFGLFQKEVFLNPSGKMRSYKQIGFRGAALAYWANPTAYESAAEVARQVGTSRAYFSRILCELVDKYGARPPVARNCDGLLRGVAAENHQRRLKRKMPLEREADEILRKAGFEV